MAIHKPENKLAAIKQEYEQKYQAELDNVKKDVESIFENLSDILHSVWEHDRPKILKGAKLEKLLSILGAKQASEPSKKEKKKGRASRTELSEDAVKAFIGKGSKTKTELSAHFKGGNVKVVKFLDGMVKGKHLETTMTKSKKNKDVTNYKVK
jgi:hypothetical protein